MQRINYQAFAVFTPECVLFFCRLQLRCRFSSCNATNTNVCVRWGCSFHVSTRLHCFAKQWREKQLLLSFWNAPECYTVLRYLSLNWLHNNWFMLTGVYAGMIYLKCRQIFSINQSHGSHGRVWRPVLFLSDLLHISLAKLWKRPCDLQSSFDFSGNLPYDSLKV